jgi:ribosome-binding protein aMBF1 (putative translation factor)
MSRTYWCFTRPESSWGEHARIPAFGVLQIRVLLKRWSSHSRFPVTSLRSDLYQRIIELLVQARKDAGITQAELGKRIGQRQTFVSKFELGERRLDVAEFVLVSKAIGVDPSLLLRRAEAGLR